MRSWLRKRAKEQASVGLEESTAEVHPHPRVSLVEMPGECAEALNELRLNVCKGTLGHRTSVTKTRKMFALSITM